MSYLDPDDPFGPGNGSGPVNPHNGQGHAGGGGGNQPPTTQCPPPQKLINGVCRYEGDFSCPPGQCKDVVTGICRSPGKNEKVRESDGSEVRGNCRQLDPGKNPNAGGGGGGAAGGGGGAGAGGPKPGAPGAPGAPGSNPCPAGVAPQVCAMLGLGQPVLGELEKGISGLLATGTRYGPGVMQQLAGQSKSRIEAQVGNNQRRADEDAARRGVYTSGMAAAQHQDIRNAGDQQFGEETTAYNIDKVKADFEDKLAGIDRAQKYIDSLRSYAANLDQTQQQRESLAATIQLAYARLAQEKDLFIKQLASNKELLKLSLNSNEWIAGMNLGSRL